MQCVILAAGKGTRMGSLTDSCPKPMLQIHGRPKLVYTIENLPSVVTEVIFIVGYLGGMIRSYFGDSYAGLPIRYVQQDELNGTGGSILLVENIIQDRFLVLMGDDLYTEYDLMKLTRYSLAILAAQVEDSTSFGVLKCDKKGYLESIVERPHDGTIKLVNTGAYVLTRDYFRYKPVSISSVEYGLPQTLMQMNDKYRITVVLARKWLPIGTPKAFEEANRRIQEFIH